MPGVGYQVQDKNILNNSTGYIQAAYDNAVFTSPGLLHGNNGLVIFDAFTMIKVENTFITQHLYLCEIIHALEARWSVTRPVSHIVSQ